MPHFMTLKVLSVSYNQLNNEKQILGVLAEKAPNLEHLNLMKNPCNPVFSNEQMYKQFRARFAIWCPNLKTLDGTDFQDDKSLIEKMRSAEEAKRNKHLGIKSELAPIPEEASKAGPGGAPS